MVATMSTHDRGAFGVLLSRLAERGFGRMAFTCDLQADAEDQERWSASVGPLAAHGRTGEEALRRLVDVVAPAKAEP